jgi:hypothetical protein
MGFELRPAGGLLSFGEARRKYACRLTAKSGAVQVRPRIGRKKSAAN